MPATLEVEVSGGPSKPESFLSGNVHGNTIAGNSYLQTYDRSSDNLAAKMLPGTSTVTATAMSFITVMIGAGVLVLPNKFVELGLPMSFLMLSGCCLCSVYLCVTMHQAIGRVQERTGSLMQTLDDLGEACFGISGRYTTRFVVQAFLIGKTATYIVLIGRNLQYLMNPPSYRVWVMLCSGLFLASAFVKSVSMLEKISFVGVVCSAIYALPIVVGSVQAHFDADIGPATDMFKLGNTYGYGFEIPPASLLPNLSVFLFAFGAIDVVATARRNMKDQTKMPSALGVSHAVVGLFYLLVGVIGAWGFGDTVKDNVSESMESEHHGKWAVGYFLALAVVINLLVTIPIALYCLFSSLEAGKRKISPFMNNTIRITVVLFCAVVGVSLPYFMQVLQIFSCSLLVPLNIFFPLAFGIKAAKDSGEPYSYSRLLFDGILFAIGISCMFIGVTAAIADLKHELEKDSAAAANTVKQVVQIAAANVSKVLPE